MTTLTAAIENDPDLEFRIDSFAVPDGSRAEFEEAMRRNLAFLETLPGFRGHLVFRKTGGPTDLDVVKQYETGTKNNGRNRIAGIVGGDRVRRRFTRPIRGTVMRER